LPAAERSPAWAAELLFDRSIDPGENVNLIGREPGHAAELRALLDDHLAGEGAANVMERDVRAEGEVRAPALTGCAHPRHPDGRKRR
jgi:hypothetical protein